MYAHVFVPQTSAQASTFKLGLLGVAMRRGGGEEEPSSEDGDGAERERPSATNRHSDSADPSSYHDNGDESDSTAQGPFERRLRVEEAA